MGDFQGIYSQGGGGANTLELLTGCRFHFTSQSVQDRPILEISGLTLECPPAGGNQNFGSMNKGQKMRQATPTNNKYVPVVIKCVAINNVELFDWYQKCNNDNINADWNNLREEASIWAYDQAGAVKARWDILNCYPCKYGGPEFKSGDENMANELIELVHEGIKRME